MANKVSGIPIGRGKASVGRRAALVILADLLAGAWLALQVSKPARAGANVVYLPVVFVAPRLVWDMGLGNAWDSGAVWG